MDNIKNNILLVIILLLVAFSQCSNSTVNTEVSGGVHSRSCLKSLNAVTEYSKRDLIRDVEVWGSKPGLINMVTEIPAGSNQKWEVSDTGQEMKWEIKRGKPRTVSYIGYPGNYGYIPGTMQREESGGDGDPLDIIAIGGSFLRGSVSEVRVIGMLKFLDRGETDHKVIAVCMNSDLKDVADLRDLNAEFSGISEILKIWFLNYKGKNKMEFLGFADRNETEIYISNSLN